MRDRSCVDATRSAARDQREIADVVALLGAYLSDQIGHLPVNPGEHYLVSLVFAHVHLVADAGNRTMRALDIKLDIAAKEIVSRNIAEHEVGIGYRRDLALAVGGGTGIGTGALRTDPQEAKRIDPGE